MVRILNQAGGILSNNKNIPRDSKDKRDDHHRDKLIILFIDLWTKDKLEFSAGLRLITHLVINK